MYTMSVKQRQASQEAKMRRQLVADGILSHERNQDILSTRPPKEALVYVIAPSVIIWVTHNKNFKPACPKELNYLKIVGSIYPWCHRYDNDLKKHLTIKLGKLLVSNAKNFLRKKFNKHLCLVVSEYWKAKGYSMGAGVIKKTGESYVSAMYKGKAFTRLVLQKKEKKETPLTKAEKLSIKRQKYWSAKKETYECLEDYNPLSRLKHSNYTFISPYNDLHGTKIELSGLTKPQWFNLACLDHSSTSGGKHQSDIMPLFSNTNYHGE